VRRADVPVTQQALQHENRDGEPHVRPDHLHVDVDHKLMVLPENVSSEGQPESEADEVEVVVGGDPQDKLQEKGVGLAREEEDDEDGGEEQRAHAGHAVPVHFVPLVRGELLHCTHQLLLHTLTAQQGCPVVAANQVSFQHT
jgi:hypothetical protein